MKLTRYFWLTLALMIILFTIPTIQTYNAPAYDGQRTYGFPLLANHIYLKNQTPKSI